ncbi:unnamed protein product [Spirodela intermedia]|uniref:Uncharacterized protein n=1 Tax=Spirodela intermedia TaxID=51605 RepID=A0A7I8IMJ8_SPIIN|nr:unnamed protein product [Spirodela intermedia]CAA6658773.1 unnamed protein product [Spirodela intermedia]
MEAEGNPKRPREDAEGEETGVDERHRPQKKPSYQRLLSLLLEEAVDGEGGEGELSSLISALQHELSPSLDAPSDAGEEDVEGIMRRLAEASDDELGIPPSASFQGAAAEEQPVYAGEGGVGDFCVSVDDAAADRYCDDRGFQQSDLLLWLHQIG